MQKKVSPIKAVLFDFDGTLTQPGAIDFDFIRRELGCPSGLPVLEFIEQLPTAKKKARARAALAKFETAAARTAKPNPGAETLIADLRKKGLFIGIITRNSRRCIEISLQNFSHRNIDDFDVVITRDDPFAPKPSGAGIIWAARKWGIDPGHVAMVGDFIFDMQAGQNAGALTVLLENDLTSGFPELKGDFNIKALTELAPIINNRRALAAGKLPNRLLKPFLDNLSIRDPSVLISARVGEDIAAIDLMDSEVLVLKSDPITFATDKIGHYAVVVNANDIATSGAVPRWFLTTLLFPVGTTAAEIGSVMAELQSVCDSYDISLCGGHTEITDAVSRPVITGMLAGVVKKSDLIEKRNLSTGNQILLTKGVAIEGTAIIAREFGPKLKQLGMSTAEINTCRQFIDSISVLKEARIAAAGQATTAMHDVTEGGLATALEELSMAGGHKIRVHMDQIPILPQSAKIGGLLDINPLGLIGSGSLLIACRKNSAAQLIKRISAAGVAVACIGEVLEPGVGIEAKNNLQAAVWPKFETDEITKLFG